jgi:hypothetical protein
MVATTELKEVGKYRAAHPQAQEGEPLSPWLGVKERSRRSRAGVRAIIGIAAAIALAGCERNAPSQSAHQPAGDSRYDGSRNSPTVRSAKIHPWPPTRNVPLEVSVEADAPNMVPISFQYQWNINGAPVAGETNRTLDSSRLKRGDRVSVDIIPVSASGQGNRYHVGEETVQNAPPVVRTIGIQPIDPRINDSLRAEVEAVDADHDLVHVTYRWHCNDRLVKESEEPFLSLTGYRAGDRFMVEAIPADREGIGQPVFSEPVLIQNSPPTVTAPPPPLKNLERYEYTVQAMDPDADPLRFSLVEAPVGMTIERTSGRVVWEIPPGASGTHKAKILVEDDHGGSVIQNIDLTLVAGAS